MLAVVVVVVVECWWRREVTWGGCAGAAPRWVHVSALCCAVAFHMHAPQGYWKVRREAGVASVLLACGICVVLYCVATTRYGTGRW